MFVGHATLSANSLAADIQGNDGWKTLSEAVAEYDIDPAFIDQALDAGGEINCVRKKPNGKKSYQTLNGWFLNGDDARIVTNGHFMYDDEGQKRTDFSNCYIAMNRDVLASDEYQRVGIDSDPDHYRFGGPNPAGKDEGQDRATLPLSEVGDLSGKVHPLAPEMTMGATIKAGDVVFMLSAARAFHLKTSKGHFEPMLQRCVILRVDDSTTWGSRSARTDCDSHKGVSSSLVFVPSPDRQASLIPVGIQAGAKEYGGLDGRPPDPDHNTSIFVIFDDKFFNMPVTRNELLAESR
jgi:hypothetical protein